MAKKLVLLVLFLAIGVLHSTNAQVPAVFILGDSTADVGTNSFLPNSTARADFPPYGIDFPFSRPTGRFSNGLNSADFLAKLMGFKRSPPPFLSVANNTKIFNRPSFRGVNLASGGSGIFDTTGQTMLTLMKFGNDSSPLDASLNNQNVVPLGEQIEQFATVRDRLMARRGPEATKTFLSKSLFFISVGSNDIFYYYLLRSSIPKQEFIASLGTAYENHLRNLLKLGAKKIGIISIPPIGCCPSQRISNSTGGCLEGLNEIARDFHLTINSLMCNLSSEFKDLKYSIGNAYEMTINVIENPGPFNFSDVEHACCTGSVNGPTFCGPGARVCSNRYAYLFWDSYHPTMAASRLAALTLYGGDTRFVAPINFSQLAKA